MNINRNNYEAILLDYLEGRLSPEESAATDLFLEQNPDILAEFHSLKSGFDLPEMVISAPDFSYLKKPVEPTLVLNADIVEKLAHPNDPTLPDLDLERLAALHPELTRDIALLRVSKVHYTNERIARKPQKIWSDEIAPVDALAVMAAEGDLNVAQMRAMQSFAPAEWVQKVESLSKVKVRPSAIFYPDKNSLYRTPVVALWHQSSWARIAAAVILLFCGWLAFSPVESPEGLTARMAEINERVPQKFQYTKKNNIAGAEKPAMRMAEESTPTEIQTERVSGPAPLAFLPVSEAISSFQVDIIASTSSVSTFAPWTDSEDDLPVPSPVNTSIWEQLARRGVDELLNLDRDPNESLTSALIDKATSKLNESDRVLVQLPGPKPEKQLAGWKVRLGQLQVAKQDR